MSNGILLYPDAQHRTLAVRFVNVAGQTFDLASKTWADNPTAALVTLTKLVAPDVAGWQVCAVPDLPANSGPVAVFVHLASGGPPIDAPFPLTTPSASILFGAAFAS